MSGCYKSTQHIFDLPTGNTLLTTVMALTEEELKHLADRFEEASDDGMVSNKDEVFAFTSQESYYAGSSENKGEDLFDVGRKTCQ